MPSYLPVEVDCLCGVALTAAFSRLLRSGEVHCQYPSRPQDEEIQRDEDGHACGRPMLFDPKAQQDGGDAVERAQGSWRYEFYACHDLPHRLERLNEHIDAFAHLYNHHRPHGALGGRTPNEYLTRLSQGDSTSQMS